MYSCPVAKVTNHHTLGDLKQEVFSLIVLEAKSSKERCQQDYASPEGFRRHSIPCLFQVLVVPSILWIVAASL